MQTSQDRFREHERTRRQSMSGFGLRDYRSSSWRIRYTRAQHTMRSAAVVVFDPRFQNRTQMCFRHWNQPMEAFSSYCPDHALESSGRDPGDTVLPAALAEPDLESYPIRLPA